VIEHEDLGALVQAPLVDRHDLSCGEDRDHPAAESDVEAPAGEADRDRVVRAADPDACLAVGHRCLDVFHIGV
jgi:hypothetical protein